MAAEFRRLVQQRNKEQRQTDNDANQRRRTREAQSQRRRKERENEVRLEQEREMVKQREEQRKEQEKRKAHELVAKRNREELIRLSSNIDFKEILAVVRDDILGSKIYQIDSLLDPNGNFLGYRLVHFERTEVKFDTYHYDPGGDLTDDMGHRSESFEIRTKSVTRPGYSFESLTIGVARLVESSKFGRQTFKLDDKGNIYFFLQGSHGETTYFKLSDGDKNPLTSANPIGRLNRWRKHYGLDMGISETDVENSSTIPLSSGNISLFHEEILRYSYGMKEDIKKRRKMSEDEEGYFADLMFGQDGKG